MSVLNARPGVTATASHGYFIGQVTNSANLTLMLWFSVTSLSVAFR